MLSTYGWVDKSGRRRPDSDRRGHEDHARAGPAGASRGQGQHRSDANEAPRDARTRRIVVRACRCVSSPLRGGDAGRRRRWPARRPPATSAKPGMPSSAMPAPLREIGFDQNIDRALPLDMPFTDEQRPRRCRSATISARGRSCWCSCTTTARCSARTVLNALASSLDVMSLEPGKDFDVVTISFDPRETPALAAAKKATYLAALQAAGRRGGMALPDRRRSRRSIARPRPPASASCGTSGLKQFAHPTGHHRADAGRPDRAVSVRHRVRSARSAPGARRCVGRQGRLGRRSLPALLLSLRPDDRPLRPGRSCARSASRAPRPCSRSARSSASWFARERPTRPRAQLGRSRSCARRNRCGPALPLFPEQASTMAARVDNLYFFLLAVSVFFSLLIAGLIVFYAVRYRRRSPDAVGARHPRRPAARDRLDASSRC